MKTFAAVSVVLVLSSLGACQSSNGSSSNADETVAAPSGLVVEPLDGGAHLTWHDNSDNEASFMIERKMPGEDWMTVGMVPFNTTAFHDPQIMAGVTYMYRVMAMPKSGDHGSYSNEAMCMGPAGSGAAGSGSTGHDAHHSGGA
jgi:hypothetical protein